MPHLIPSISGGTVSLIVLTALYGVYLVLFVLATWSTYLRPNSLSLPLRISVLTMFGLLLTHFVLEFYIWSIVVGDSIEGNKSYVAMMVVDNVITCLSASIAQGHLAWRSYILWGRPQWMKRVIPVAIALGNGLGALSNAAFTSHNEITYQLLCAWGWWSTLMFSALAGGTLFRIAKNRSVRKSQMGAPIMPRRSATAIRMVVESSIISWVGIISYMVVSTVYWAGQDSQGVWTAVAGIFTVLPILFGIAHSLSVALIGLSHFVSATPPKRSTLAFAPAATTHTTDIQSGFVIKLGDNHELTDMPSPPAIRVEHETIYHKD